MNPTNLPPAGSVVESPRPHAPSSSTRRGRRLVPAVLWTLAGISALAALVRIGSVLYALSLPELPADHFEAYYIEHLTVVSLHLVPAVAFVLLGPMQFSVRFRRRWPAWHRWAGRVFVLSGISAGLSAQWMNEFFPPVGGALKYWANVGFGILMVAALVISVRAILRGDVARHRAWMARGYAIGLGAATQRLIILPVFLVAGEPSDVVIGALVWVGWGLNLAVAELYLRYGLRPWRRARMRRARTARRRAASATTSYC